MENDQQLCIHEAKYNRRSESLHRGWIILIIISSIILMVCATILGLLIKNDTSVPCKSIETTTTTTSTPQSLKWSLTGTMNYGRFEHTASTLPNGKILVTGGQNIYNDHLNKAELYDLSSAYISYKHD